MEPVHCLCLKIIQIFQVDYFPFMQIECDRHAGAGVHAEAFSMLT